MLLRALQWAIAIHGDQVDKAGKPYMEHVLRVAFAQADDEARVVALLHDVVEDSEMGFEDLRKDFPEKIVEQVEALSRRKGERYAAYIRRVAHYGIASRVKIADLKDNLRLDRRAAVSDSLVKRYELALQFLQSGE